MEYPNCEKCIYNLTCAVRFYCLDIKYCQYQEVDEHPYNEEE